MGQREGRFDATALSGRIVEQALELVKTVQELASGAQTAGELEAEVVEAMRRFGAGLLGELLSARFGKQQGRWRACECGGRQKFIGYRARRAVTLLGDAQVERACYRCLDWGAMYYVGAVELGDAQGGKTVGVQEALSLLAAHMPFGEATDKLGKLLGIRTCTSEAEKQAERWGDRLEAAAEAEVEAVFEHHLEVLPEATPERLYVALDGCKVELRDQWREARIGAVYDTRGRDEEGIDRAGRTTYVGLVHRHYHEFGQRLYVEAMRRGGGQAQELIVLGDGAPWIWELAQMHFPGATQIVDWYHASQHLWTVAHAVYGEGTDRAREWAERQHERLRAGHVDRVVRTLRTLRTHHPAHADLFRTNAEYFRTNRHRMRYHQFRRRGLHIGSGVVESACRHASADRLKRAGMRWTQRGAQATLNLRLLDLNGRWDAYWHHQKCVA
jgi:hypothetical protein